jgi:hypothetical protein
MKRSPYTIRAICGGNKGDRICAKKRCRKGHPRASEKAETITVGWRTFIASGASAGLGLVKYVITLASPDYLNIARREAAEAPVWRAAPTARLRMTGASRAAASDGVGRGAAGDVIRRDRELHTQAVQHLENGVVARFRPRHQCLVQALSTQSGILGELRHSARLGHVAKRQEKQIRVVFFQYGRQVFWNRLLVI